MPEQDCCVVDRASLQDSFKILIPSPTLLTLQASSMRRVVYSPFSGDFCPPSEGHDALCASGEAELRRNLIHHVSGTEAQRDFFGSFSMSPL